MQSRAISILLARSDIFISGLIFSVLPFSFLVRLMVQVGDLLCFDDRFSSDRERSNEVIDRY